MAAGARSTYGSVWTPTRVAAGWTPYRDGHWAWVDPWGWTWVDDAPWGFAVSHYGRWANFNGTWGWVPGPPREQAVYAPALVAFVGGGNLQVSVSVGSAAAAAVGWFPLAPREVYQPSYPVSRGYFDHINRSNAVIAPTTITNVYNTTTSPTRLSSRTQTNIVKTVYVNQQVNGAVVAVPAQAFAQSQSVARAAVPLSREAALRAPVAQLAAVAPMQQSVHGGAPVALAKPPARELAVVAHTAPPPPPVPFAEQQKHLATNPGKPIDEAQRVQLKPAVVPGPAAKVSVIAAARAPAPAAAPPATAPAPKTPGPQGRCGARAGCRWAPGERRQIGRGTGDAAKAIAANADAAKAEAARAEAAKAEAMKADAAKASAARADAARADATKADATKADAAKADAAKAEAAKAEAAKAEAAKAEAGKAEAARAEAAKAQTAKVEAAKRQTAKMEAAQAEANRADAAKADATKAEARRVEAARAEAMKAGAAKADAAKAESARPAAAKADVSRTDAAQAEAARANVAKAESARVDTARAEAGKAEAARAEAARGEAAKGAEANKVAAAKAEAGRAESAKTAATRGEATKAEAARVEVAKADATRVAQPPTVAAPPTPHASSPRAGPEAKGDEEKKRAEEEPHKRKRGATAEKAPMTTWGWGSAPASIGERHALWRAPTG
jgi:hypothetical protein